MIGSINKSKCVSRQSNIEILRIVAMLLIVLHHLGIYGLKDGGIIIQFLDSITIIGVNIFLLISGFFSIKLRWSSLLNLFFLCLFFNLLHVFLDSILFDIVHTPGDYIKAFMAFSHPGGWFMNVYFCLVLFSPLLNLAFKQMDQKLDVLILVCLSVINVYLGFFLHNDVNNSGYNLSQFIYIYYLGHLIHKYFKTLCEIKKKYFILLYLVSSFITLILSYFGMKYWNFHYYNSPFVIISAVCVFSWFARLEIRNIKFVNDVAKSMLAVYLFSNRGGVATLIYKLSRSIYTFSNEILVILGFIALLFGIFVCAIVIDRFRILICSPLLRWLDVKIKTTK